MNNVGLIGASLVCLFDEAERPVWSSCSSKASD